MFSNKSDLIEQVMEVRRKSDRIMSIKLVVGAEICNVVSVYASQVGLDEVIKRLFWEDLDEVVTLMDIWEVEWKVMRRYMEAWDTV